MGEHVGLLHIMLAYDSLRQDLRSLQVNHLATALLSLLLMPNLIRTAQAHGTISRMVIVSSDMHYSVKLEEELLDAPSLLQKLSDKTYCTPEVMEQRYSVTKRAFC